MDIILPLFLMIGSLGAATVFISFRVSKYFRDRTARESLALARQRELERRETKARAAKESIDLMVRGA